MPNGMTDEAYAAFLESEERQRKRRGQFAVAGMKDLPDGRRIWIPPGGRPYWVGGANAGPDLTLAECERHGLKQGEPDG